MIPIRLIYIYKEDCSAIKELKAHFETDKSVEAIFLKKIPDDFLEYFSEEKAFTAVVFDDLHYEALSNRDVASLLYEFSSVLAHHHNLYCFFSVQSFDIVKKQSKLNNVFLNSSHVIFFRTAHDCKSIKRFLNNYEIALQGSTTLFDIFKKYIQTKRFAYMLICVSPRCEKQSVFSNVLMKEKGLMLSFHELSDSEPD